MSTGIKELIQEMRHNRGWAVRRIAREMGMTVPKIHQTCGCTNGANCAGPGCRV